MLLAQSNDVPSLRRSAGPDRLRVVPSREHEHRAHDPESWNARRGRFVADGHRPAHPASARGRVRCRWRARLICRSLKRTTLTWGSSRRLRSTLCAESRRLSRSRSAAPADRSSRSGSRHRRSSAAGCKRSAWSAPSTKWSATGVSLTRASRKTVSSPERSRPAGSSHSPKLIVSVTRSRRSTAIARRR